MLQVRQIMHCVLFFFVSPELSSGRDLVIQMSVRRAASAVHGFFVRSRDAKFPGILRAVNFHREYWEFWGNIGNFGEYSETLGILK